MNYDRGNFKVFENLDTIVDDKNDSNPRLPTRILIVDDEPFNVNGIKVIVQCLTANIKGFEINEHVDVARNGVQACEIF